MSYKGNTSTEALTILQSQLLNQLVQVYTVISGYCTRELTIFHPMSNHYQALSVNITEYDDLYGNVKNMERGGILAIT